MYDLFSIKFTRSLKRMHASQEKENKNGRTHFIGSVSRHNENQVQHLLQSKAARTMAKGIFRTKAIDIVFALVGVDSC